MSQPSVSLHVFLEGESVFNMEPTPKWIDLELDPEALHLFLFHDFSKLV